MWFLGVCVLYYIGFMITQHPCQYIYILVLFNYNFSTIVMEIAVPGKAAESPSINDGSLIPGVRLSAVVRNSDPSLLLEQSTDENEP